MKITKDDVLKTATLANLEIGENEADELTADFCEIIAFADSLNELDIEGTEPLTQPFAVENVFREDKIAQDFEKKELIKNAPKTFDGYFEVPKTIEQ